MVDEKRNDLFYLCSLIEYIGREQKLERKDVVQALGEKMLQHIYEYADVFHCEPIAKTADELIQMCKIPSGNFDNVASCQYKIPSYWGIGKVYSRLIMDIAKNRNVTDEKGVIDVLVEIYHSWISDSISYYNSDFYYQPRDYIRECYLKNEVL